MFSKLTRPQVKLHRMNNTPALTNTTPLNQMKQLVRTATAPQSLAKIHLTQKIQAVSRDADRDGNTQGSNCSLASGVAAASGSAPLQYNDPLPQAAKECEYSFVNNYVH